MILMVIKSSKIKAPRQGFYDSNVGLYGYKMTKRPYDRRDQSSLASDAQITMNKGFLISLNRQDFTFY